MWTPWSNGKQGEKPPNPGEALLGYLKQPPPSPHGSSQVDTAHIMAHSSHSLSHGTLERDTSPTPLPLPANSVNLSDDVLHLQEEMNDAMVHLLSARATIDMHCQWVISETEVGHCQNEIDTSEPIREIKSQYATMIGDAGGHLQDCHEEGRGCLLSLHQQSRGHPRNWDKESQSCQCNAGL